MTREELISKITAYVRNSAIDSFTDLRLQSILLAIVGGGVSAVYETSADFDVAIAANPDEYQKAYLVKGYEGDRDVIYEYFPAVLSNGDGAIMWTAATLKKRIKSN